MYQTGRTKIIDLEREYWTVSLIYIVRERNLCLKSRKHLEDVNESFIAMNSLCRFSFGYFWACVYSSAPEPRRTLSFPKLQFSSAAHRAAWESPLKASTGAGSIGGYLKLISRCLSTYFMSLMSTTIKKIIEKIKKAQEYNFMRGL